MVVSIATRPRTSGILQSATSQENHPVRGEEEEGGGRKRREGAGRNKENERE